MKHIKIFEEFFPFNSKENIFDELKKLLSNITFDDQSIGLKQVSILTEIENQKELDKIRDTLYDIIDGDDVSIEQAVEDLFYQIDMAIGTSSNQEKELKFKLAKFIKSIMQ